MLDRGMMAEASLKGSRIRQEDRTKMYQVVGPHYVPSLVKLIVILWWDY